MLTDYPLGIGVIQLNFGLNYMFDVPENTLIQAVLAVVFFVTSGDSGALVLSNFTSILKDVNSDAPIWMRILWAAVIGVLTLALLMAGGLSALQGAVVITGLPFSTVLFLMMIGLFKALQVETFKVDSHRPSLAGHLSGRTLGDELASHNWRRRLARAMRLPDYRYALRFLREVGVPAIEEVRDALRQEDLAVEVVVGGDEGYAALNVSLGHNQDFTYQIWLNRCPTPSFAICPNRSEADYYRAEVHLLEGSQGYDLMDYTKEQVIEDILDQYERHLYSDAMSGDAGQAQTAEDKHTAPTMCYGADPIHCSMPSAFITSSTESAAKIMPIIRVRIDAPL